MLPYPPPVRVLSAVRHSHALLLPLLLLVLSAPPSEQIMVSNLSGCCMLESAHAPPHAQIVLSCILWMYLILNQLFVSPLIRAAAQAHLPLANLFMVVYQQG